MEEKEATGHYNKRKIKQPPSVAFLWEERPGIAKKDWKPEASSVTTTLPSPTPIKLIASVPFNWEEKPGTPLPSFSQPPLEPATVSPSALLITLRPPPVYSPTYFNGCNTNDDGGDGNDEQQVEFEIDLEAFGFETDDSFSSAPSLLANCLVASTAISTAVPVQNTYHTDNSSDYLETPSSPALKTESSTSSYATGTSSLVGASFLECLFPLLPPNSGFLEKVRYPDQESQAQSHFDRESNNTVIIRRPPTLGELIMMSRRRSYQRKVVQRKDHHLSMVILNFMLRVSTSIA
ncbi:hypothetical protein REPUB_Repub07fG0119300 [Reevesia pubescens]